MTVNAGSEDGAVFRCRHMMSGSIIWEINGLDLPPGPTVQAIDENGTRVSTLTVPATLDYNGTQVVCVAFTSNGREETPSVTLTVIEGA